MTNNSSLMSLTFSEIQDREADGPPLLCGAQNRLYRCIREQRSRLMTTNALIQQVKDEEDLILRKYELLTSATLRSFGTLREVCFALLRSASVGDIGDGGCDGNEAVVDGGAYDSKENIETWANMQVTKALTDAGYEISHLNDRDPVTGKSGHDMDIDESIHEPPAILNDETLQQTLRRWLEQEEIVDALVAELDQLERYTQEMLIFKFKERTSSVSNVPAKRTIDVAFG
ncbi:hypothetical protein BC937DRAFT_86431 [Endogone sp. FLAS-F59071]|nr:hypothetical protein BC937DRAFT_86431 [Endogone sp. FLAS-F59071]|eukprot:RUS22847.1 hypothetical protein BC937DRAFT_86431 [Endogone sp. FLAS-F59071]